MTPQDWDRAYMLAWERYYSYAHIETVLRRAPRPFRRGAFAST